MCMIFLKIYLCIYHGGQCYTLISNLTINVHNFTFVGQNLQWKQLISELTMHSILLVYECVCGRVSYCIVLVSLLVVSECVSVV